MKTTRMFGQHLTQHTCSACGEGVDPDTHWCPRCNRNSPPLAVQLVMLTVVLVGFTAFCAVLYYSAK
jgi:uncharacterized OB-fold protein